MTEGFKSPNQIILWGVRVFCVTKKICRRRLSIRMQGLAVSKISLLLDIETITILW
jgi:hypothetical protein